MAARKGAMRSSNACQHRCDELKDEVYRHMFRLEANRPGADVDLAAALLRGWLASYSDPEELKLREWLAKVCPVCLLLIEAGRLTNASGQECVP